MVEGGLDAAWGLARGAFVRDWSLTLVVSPRRRSGERSDIQAILASRSAVTQVTPYDSPRREASLLWWISLGQKVWPYLILSLILSLQQGLGVT